MNNLLPKTLFKKMFPLSIKLSYTCIITDTMKSEFPWLVFLYSVPSVNILLSFRETPFAGNPKFQTRFHPIYTQNLSFFFLGIGYYLFFLYWQSSLPITDFKWRIYLRLNFINQGRVFVTITRNMFGLRSLVKRFREFGWAAMRSLFWPNVNRSLWSVTLDFKMADCKK